MRILLIEDDESIQDLMCCLVKSFFSEKDIYISVDQCYNLDQIKKIKEKYEIIITDWHLGYENNEIQSTFSYFSKLKRISKKIIICSGSKGDVQRDLGEDFELYDFLPKPFKIVKLENILDEFLKNKI
jgi:DNA-binding response OmpR family regulator